jgi:hypothetical protein
VQIEQGWISTRLGLSPEPVQDGRHWTGFSIRGATPSGCRLRRRAFTGGSSSQPSVNGDTHGFALRGAPDGYGPFVRFSWTLGSPDGAPVVGGMDVVRLDHHGRISEVVGFLDG